MTRASRTVVDMPLFQYSQSAELSWRHQAWTAVLVLVTMVLVFTAAVRFTVRGRKVHVV